MTNEEEALETARKMAADIVIHNARITAQALVMEGPAPADAVDKRSMARSRTNRHRMFVMAAFFLIMALLFAYLLQLQQAQLTKLINDNRTLIVNMCIERQVNTIKTNDNWDKLAEIERYNRFIDDRLRGQRLRVYQEAKLVVPDCKV